MILVTGGTGFLGLELIKQLLDGGEKVRALKREFSIVSAMLDGQPNLEWVHGDVLDYFSLEQAFEGVLQVYHCAGLISLHAADHKRLLEVNVSGTANIVNLCIAKKVKKLVHVSSIVALGESKTGQLITEEDSWTGDDNYGYSQSKYEGEMEVWRGTVEGIAAVIVNPSIIIGKNAGTAGSGQLFEIVRKGFRYYPSGTCGFVDVEDVASVMITLMNSDIESERFIVNSENLSYRRLFEKAAEGFKVSPPSIKAQPWMFSLAWRAVKLLSLITGKRYGITKRTSANAIAKQEFSNEKIRKAIGIEFKPINKSIAEICTAFKSNQSE